MRQMNYVFLAMGCGLFAVPVACGSNSGVENGGGSGTGGSGFSFTGGDGSTGGSPYNNFGGSGNSTSTSVGGTDSSSTSTGCKQQDVSIQALPPDILLVLDRSMSMTQRPDGSNCVTNPVNGNGQCAAESKWNQTIDAVKAVVQGTQGAVNWGLWWLGLEVQQCGTSQTPAVPIIPVDQDSYTPIQTALDAITFDTGALGTPTAAIINYARTYMSGLTDQNPKFLLLATDGEPNCENGNLMSNTGQATTAVGNAYAQGIPTFVVGISSIASALAALDSAAVAGGYPQTNGTTSYYQVTDTQSLSDTLMSIIGLATSCTIPLDGTPQNVDEWNIAITATDSSGNVAPVPNSATDGWAYTDTSRTSVTLVGTYCDGMKNGSFTDFKFLFTCKNTPLIY
jgi:hypothetical protein